VSLGNFTLHPQLAADCLPVGDFALCRVLLMNNRNFPWLVLVPKREGLRELFDLSSEDYAQTMTEIRRIAETFRVLTNADKMNIAALGNIVPQLHIHVIARYENDDAWPNPVWNSGVAASAYSAEESRSFITKIRAALGL
jgi:diadenosine tetraphosphate (Ap4A) HIT family hydrolase